MENRAKRRKGFLFHNNSVILKKSPENGERGAIDHGPICNYLLLDS